MQNKVDVSRKNNYRRIFGVSIIAFFMLLTAAFAVTMFATPVAADDNPNGCPWDTLFEDDFENGGTIDTNKWSIVGDAAVTDLTVHEGSYSLQLDGGDDPDDAVISTTISTLGHKDIELSYYRLLDSLEDDNGFVAEYTVDGSTWTVLEDVYGDDDTFTYQSFDLSGADDLGEIAIRLSVYGGADNDLAVLDLVKVRGEQIDCEAPTMEDIVEAEFECYNSTAPVFSNLGFDDNLNLHLAQYKIDDGTWTDLFNDIDATEWNNDGWTLPGFAGLADGEHTVTFYVEDDYGNSNTYTWTFCKDVTPPTATDEITGPIVTMDGWTYPMIGPNSIAWIHAVDDSGCCECDCGDHVMRVEYSLQGFIPGSTIVVYDNQEGDENDNWGEIDVALTFDEDCHHEVNYRAMDCCGNWNPSPSGSYALDFYVDASYPDTTYVVDGIELPAGGIYTWLGSCSTKWLYSSDEGCEEAWDGGAGSEILKVQVSKWNYQATNPSFETIDYFEVHDQYDVNGDGDLDDAEDVTFDPVGVGGFVDEDPAYGKIAIPFQFQEDCKHEVMHWSVDYLGNDEIDVWETSTNKQNHYVDLQHPESYLGQFDGCFYDLPEFCVNTGTDLTIMTDNVGVDPCIYPEYYTFFRIYVGATDTWYPDQTDGTGLYGGLSNTPDVRYFDSSFGDREGWFYVYTEGAPFEFIEECDHTLEFFAKDPLCNTEDLHSYTVFVDDKEPIITKTVGTPQCPKPDEMGFEDVLCIKTTTEIDIDIVDDGCCNDLTTAYYELYEWVEDSWSLMDTYPLSIDDNEVHETINIPFECQHKLVIVAEDCLGNTATHIEKFFVDNQAPDIDKDVLGTQCYKGIITTPDSQFGDMETFCIKTTPDSYIKIMDAWDEGCCNELDTVVYEYWYDGQHYGPVTVYDANADPPIDTLPHRIDFDRECEHVLKITATDCLGNEFVDCERFLVDDTAPDFEKVVHGDQCYKGFVAGTEYPEVYETYCIKTFDYSWVTIEDAWDLGCCDTLDTVSYRIKYDGVWSDSTLIFDAATQIDELPYNIEFYDECEHLLEVTVTDCLGNTFVDTERFYVDDSAPEIDKQVTGEDIIPGNFHWAMNVELDDARSGGSDQYRFTTAWGWGGITYYMDQIEQPDAYFDETDYELLAGHTPYEFDVTRTYENNGARWIIDYDESALLEPISSSGFQLVISGDGVTPLFNVGVNSESDPVYKPYNSGWGSPTDQLPDGMEVIGHRKDTYFEVFVPYKYLGLNPDYYVSCDTDITINAWDLGCCDWLDRVYYDLEYKDVTGAPVTEHKELFDSDVSNPIDLLPYTFNFAESCDHKLTITAIDCLGNTYVDEEIFYVDCTPPETEKDIYMEIMGEESDPIIDEVFFFTDAFEDYENMVGPDLYTELADYGWDLHDYDGGDVYDDFWLEQDPGDGNHYMSIRHDSYAIIQGNTDGYHNIKIAWDWALQTDNDLVDDSFNVYWRLGNSGDWTQLASLTDVTAKWESEEFTLLADGDGLVQIKFELDNGNGDYGLLDNVKLTGEFTWLNCQNMITLTSNDLPDSPCAVGVEYLHVRLLKSEAGYGEDDWVDILQDEGEAYTGKRIYDGDPEDESDPDDGIVVYSFPITEDCLHEIVWWAVDEFGNEEEANMQYHRVDCTPPEAVKTFDMENAYLDTMTLFEDDFDDYQYMIHNPTPEDPQQDPSFLYDELVAHGWQYYDYVAPGEEDPKYEYDDLWLEAVGDDKYLSIRDNSYIMTTVSTRGYHNIKFTYDRATAEIDGEFGDTFKILWRIGDDGDWTELESIDADVDWDSMTWPLAGADDQDMIQVKFMLENGNHDFGWIDNVKITGEFYWVSCENDFTITATDKEAPCDVGVDTLYIMLEHSCRPFLQGGQQVAYLPGDGDGDPGIPQPFDFLEIEDNGQDDSNPEEGIIEYNFNLPKECYWRISWYSVDKLGNGEEEWKYQQIHKVDCTPPHVIILKPTDHWYSDGEAIPAVVLAEDLPGLLGACRPSMDCVVGIEDGKQGYAYLIDIFPVIDTTDPDFDWSSLGWDDFITELDTTNFIYDAASHEFIGNAVIPQGSGISDGAVLFVAGAEDNVGNDWDSMREVILSYIIDGLSNLLTENEMIHFLTDSLNDFIVNQNIVFLGIDNTPPEVEIVVPYTEDPGYPDVGPEPVDIVVEVQDVLSGVVTGNPCYITLDGVSMGTLYYDSSIGGCQGTLEVPMSVMHGDKELTATIADRAGALGSDTIMVTVAERPGPATSAVDVQPDPVMIYEDGHIDEGVLTITGQMYTDTSIVEGGEFFISSTMPTKADYGTGEPIVSFTPNTASGIYTSVDFTVDFDPQDYSLGPGKYTVWVHGYDAYGRWGSFDEEEFNLVDVAQWRPVTVHIQTPGDGETFDVETDGRYVPVIVNAFRPAYNDLPKDYNLDVTVKLDSPYGAPDQYYPVTWDAGMERFVTEIPIYWYSSGSQLDLKVIAEDPYWNKAEDESSFNVETTVIYDQWMEMEWNSLTLPQYAIACDNEVESVLASINNGNFDVVFHYNPDAAPGEEWTSWAYGVGGDTLTHMFAGEEYWIHVVGEPMRFYIDTGVPSVEITHPTDGPACFGPDTVEFEAFELETWIDMVYTSIYDQTTDQYWDGSIWVPNTGSHVWITSMHDYDDGCMSYWYKDTIGIWEPGHTYDIHAKSVDASGCESIVDTVTINLYDTSVYVEKTADGLENLNVDVGETFTFEIYVENDGDMPLFGVDVTDYLPDEFTYEDSAMISYNDGTPTAYEPDSVTYDDGLGANILVWNTVTTLAPGEYFVITFDATVTTTDVWEENLVDVVGYGTCTNAQDSDTAEVMGSEVSTDTLPVISIISPEHLEIICSQYYEGFYITGEAYDAETYVGSGDVSVALYYEDGGGTNQYFDGGVWTSTPTYHSVDSATGSGTSSDPLNWEITLSPSSGALVSGQTYYINAVCYDQTGNSDATTHNVIYEYCDILE